MVAWWSAVLLPPTSTESNLAPLSSRYSQAAMDPLATASINGVRPSARNGVEFGNALKEGKKFKIYRRSLTLKFKHGFAEV